MTNYERYKDYLMILLQENGHLDIGLKDGLPSTCDSIMCKNCDLRRNNDCPNAIRKWFNEEYKEPAAIDWTKIPVDTKILVQNKCDSDVWYKRHFAKYDKDTNTVYAFAVGLTSWSIDPDLSEPAVSWDRAKLAEEDEESEEYKESEVDWSKVPVNTEILVKDVVDGVWTKRYFAKYDVETKKVFAWYGGKTSWTETDAMEWRFAKLAEEN